MMMHAQSLRTLIAAAALALLGGAIQSPAQAGIDEIFSDAPIVRAARDGSVKDLNAALIAGDSVHKRAADGTPLIVLATAARSLDVVKTLIENGARPDDKSRDETTALTLAAANGDYAIASYLLDHKADVDMPGALRETALIKAARNDHADIVALLIEHGADLEATDQSGATAIDIANANHKTAIAGLLTKASKK